MRRGRRAKPPHGALRQATAEIAVPMFSYKNHLGVDRAHGFIRRFVVTDAARHDGAQLGAVLDPANSGNGVWDDSACRGKANLDLLDRRGLRPEFQRAKARGRMRRLVEHVFAGEKRGMRLVVCCVRLARGTVRNTLANLAYNMRRLAWIEGPRVPT